MIHKERGFLKVPPHCATQIMSFGFLGSKVGDCVDLVRRMGLLGYVQVWLYNYARTTTRYDW